MRGRWIITSLAASLVAGAFSAADGRTKKARAAKPDSLGITRDVDGTPIIMQGFHMPRVSGRTSELSQDPTLNTARRTVTRGSSTYIPPPNPSPYGGPPANALLHPPAPTPPPPPLNTFGDRVTSCIHSFPLNGGIGNNPAEQGAYVRSCAN